MLSVLALVKCFGSLGFILAGALTPAGPFLLPVGASLGTECVRELWKFAQPENIGENPVHSWIKQGGHSDSWSSPSWPKPIIAPTPEDLKAIKTRLEFQDGMFHMAVVGTAGSGKSSLINAFRGLRNGDAGAAPTGTVETTMNITRYPDPDPDKPYVWYDVPGAGTLNTPGERYFHDQGLYAFDGIIVLFDIRFTQIDVEILRNSARFNIPTYIVRSKSLQHIRNVMGDMPCDGGSKCNEARQWKKARTKYVEDTRKNVKQILARAELKEQRCYLVDKDVLVGLINPQKHMPQEDRTQKDDSLENAIDEIPLIVDLLRNNLVSRARPLVQKYLDEISSYFPDWQVAMPELRDVFPR
ncbi:P-loop containing nucleoside triphosphate hydrolase protein [Laetiporus sulphureus 93-53]|uniref:p-loop containing nucleoside triphosphate hydrolase protein n=1 Tax=Laetiporus sulphureus 93-53 TaxID=1314785 RepID=A0A165C7Y9_9APHY|nr:P-loop containing nucleoside triphosphate hydrolase protein [Laetiporus sulphureus 93-53]KZT02359.1 P-loop containing nucleoside triphosphate hydrolase protein [Laetiporus sulphureus 93-53]